MFDGAAARRDIEHFLPTRGNGSVLVTTANETGWWPGVRRISTGVFTPAEAAACFTTYAGLDPATEHPGITDIVERLGWMPLAVSMAGLYFGNAAGTVTELSRDYFAELDALETKAPSHRESTTRPRMPPSTMPCVISAPASVPAQASI